MGKNEKESVSLFEKIGFRWRSKSFLQDFSEIEEIRNKTKEKKKEAKSVLVSRTSLAKDVVGLVYKMAVCIVLDDRRFPLRTIVSPTPLSVPNAIYNFSTGYFVRSSEQFRPDSKFFVS